MFPDPFGLGIEIGSELLECNVVGNAHDVESLVISDESMDAPTGSLRFLFELHEQVQAAAGFRAPVQDVTNLNQMGLPTDPVEIVIDEAGVPEDGDEVVVGSMHVANGDDARHFVPFVLLGGGRGRVPEKEKDEGGK
jgi:hypothetical protein